MFRYFFTYYIEESKGSILGNIILELDHVVTTKEHIESVKKEIALVGESDPDKVVLTFILLMMYAEEIDTSQLFATHQSLHSIN